MATPVTGPSALRSMPASLRHENQESLPRGTIDGQNTSPIHGFSSPTATRARAPSPSASSGNDTSRQERTPVRTASAVTTTPVDRKKQIVYLAKEAQEHQRGRLMQPSMRGLGKPPESLKFYIRWINSFGFVKVDINKPKQFADGSVLCKLVSFLTGTRLDIHSDVSKDSMQRCIQVLRQVLTWLGTRSRVRAKNIPIAEDIYYGKKDAIRKLLAEIFSSFVLRDVSRSSEGMLRWIHAVLSCYGRSLPPTLLHRSGSGLEGFHGLWETFHNCVHIICCIHNHRAQKILLAKQEGLAPENGVLSLPDMTKVYWRPAGPEETKSNIQVAFDLLTEQGVPLFWTVEEWLDHPESTSFLWLQLDAMFVMFNDTDVCERDFRKLRFKNSSASGSNHATKKDEIIDEGFEITDEAVRHPEVYKASKALAASKKESMSLTEAIKNCKDAIAAVEADIKRMTAGNRQHLMMNEEVRKARERFKNAQKQKQLMIVKKKHFESLLYLKVNDVEAMKELIQNLQDNDGDKDQLKESSNNPENESIQEYQAKAQAAERENASLIEKLSKRTQEISRLEKQLEEVLKQLKMAQSDCQERNIPIDVDVEEVWTENENLNSELRHIHHEISRTEKQCISADDELEALQKEEFRLGETLSMLKNDQRVLRQQHWQATHSFAREFSQQKSKQEDNASKLANIHSQIKAKEAELQTLFQVDEQLIDQIVSLNDENQTMLLELEKAAEQLQEK